MPRFFIDDISAQQLCITGDDARHIGRSLRMSIGEELTVCDGSGEQCLCRILSIGDTVELEVLERTAATGEPRCRVTLYQGYPKSDKLELICQKAVELGADRIVPVITSRSVARPDAKSAEKKAERLRKIALEAAKQSGRGRIVQVESAISFDNMLTRLGGHEKCILCYESGGRPLRQVITENLGDVAVIIGPEGGFSAQEAEQCTAHGAEAVWLGPRILRTETAAIAALTAVMLQTGCME